MNNIVAVFTHLIREIQFSREVISFLMRPHPFRPCRRSDLKSMRFTGDQEVCPSRNEATKSYTDQAYQGDSNVLGRIEDQPEESA